MSFILDALRRAEAERQRGGVPGLHDQPAMAPSGAAPSLAQADERGAMTPVLWSGAGLLLVAALTVAWWLGSGGVQPVAPTTAALPAKPPMVLQQAPAPRPDAPLVMPDQPVAVQAVPPAQPLPSAKPAPVQPPLGQGPPVATTAVLPLPLPLPLPPASRPRAGIAAPALAQPQPMAPAPAEQGPVRAWANLSDATRATVPSLAWSGLVHAERADQRLVIVNGQVVREGDTLAAGLQLLQIRPKSVVLRWQGQRIEMPL